MPAWENLDLKKLAFRTALLFTEAASQKPADTNLSRRFHSRAPVDRRSRLQKA
jgi:hypothetical protein